MWIVRLALRRTYTFVVAALLIAVVGGVSIYRMSTDIFPEINIPNDHQRRLAVHRHAGRRNRKADHPAQ